MNAVLQSMVSRRMATRKLLDHAKLQEVDQRI